MKRNRMGWGPVVLMLIGLIAPLRVESMEPMVRQRNPLIGQPAPEFDVGDGEVRQRSFTDIHDGKKTILFFWATWCPHCRRELQEIYRRRAEFPTHDVNLMLIDVGEDQQQVSAYLKRAGVMMDGFLDWDGKISDQFGVRGLPTYVYVNENGTVTAFEHQLPNDFLALFTTAQ